MKSKGRNYKIISVCYRRILYILLILSSTVSIVAQQKEFNKHLFVQNRSTVLRNIMVDGDSLLISGDIGRDSMGLSGIILFRIDTLSNIGALKVFRDTSLTDHLLLSGRNPIIEDRNGKIILGGVLLHQNDLVVLKLNNDFSRVFYKVYPMNFPTLYIEGIKEYLDAYYLVGTVQTINDDHDVFLQKVDSSGNMVWAKTYGVPSRDETSRAILIEDTVITILITEAFDNTPTIKNDSRYWIRFVRIDTSGTILKDWKEEVTGEEGWSGSLIKFDNDYIYTTNLLGEEYGFGYFQAGQVVRRDQDFKIIWRRPYGAPDNYFNGLGDLIISSDKNLLITGQILDESKKLVMQRVIKICPNGDSIWEVRNTGLVQNNGESLNFMEGIAASNCNSSYAVGYTYKSAGFYEGLILKISGDGCIDTLCSTTNIENIIVKKESGMVIYPNPSTTSIDISVDKDVFPFLVKPKINIIDMNGNIIVNYTLVESTSHISLDGVPNGIYLAVLESNDITYSVQKLVIDN